MMELDTDLVVTDRRRRARRAAASRAAETTSRTTTSELSADENEDDDFEVAESSTDRRRADRRRQIDPTTCERDYTGGEVEFMRAMDDYKRKSGRPFPTWSEVLEVLISLGYRKVAEPSTMEWRTHGESSN